MRNKYKFILALVFVLAFFVSAERAQADLFNNNCEQYGGANCSFVYWPYSSACNLCTATCQMESCCNGAWGCHGCGTAAGCTYWPGIATFCPCGSCNPL